MQIKCNTIVMCKLQAPSQTSHLDVLRDKLFGYAQRLLHGAAGYSAHRELLPSTSSGLAHSTCLKSKPEPTRLEARRHLDQTSPLGSSSS